MSLLQSPPKVNQPYLTITMTGNSHDVEIELSNNNSLNGEDGCQTLQDDSTCQDQALSPGLDFPDEFQSCSESLTPRHSLERERVLESSKLLEDSGKQTSSLISSASSVPSSIDRSSTTTLRATQVQSQEAKNGSNGMDEPNQQWEIENGNHAPLEPSIEISTAEDSADQKSIPKQQKTFEPIYVGGLKDIREIDSDSAKSPTLASPTVPISVPVPKKTKSQGSISLLDRFGRDVFLRRNQEDKMDEVRVDEDGNYYVVGDEGFRVRLKEGQIQSDNTSQPFCISYGKRVNISVIADRLRNTALQDPRPAADEPPVTPRTEPVINNSTNGPLPSSIRHVSKPANIQTSTPKARDYHSRNPWMGIFTSVAEKSRHATTYLAKGARSKMRSSGSQPVQPQPPQQDTSRISSRTSSANKSELETGDSGEKRSRRLPFLNQKQGTRFTPVANIKKQILSRRSWM